MSSKEHYYIWMGVVSTLTVLIFFGITVAISDYLLKYSGIITLYSLLAIFITYTMQNLSNKREERRDIQNMLRSLLRASHQVQKDMDYYATSFANQKVPPTVMGSFEYAGLPLEIDFKSTKRLEDLLIFANSKIETINNWKDDYFDIIMMADEKEMKKSHERFLKVWGNTSEVAFNELKQTIEDLRSELAKWIRTEL